MFATDAPVPTDGALRRPTHDLDRRILVNETALLRLQLAQQHRQGDLAAAANARLLRAHRAGAERRFRARIGRSIIRLGERLAAESPLEPARPR